MTAAPDFALAGSTIASAHTKNSSKITVNAKITNTRRGAHFNASALVKQIRELGRGAERPRLSLFGHGQKVACPLRRGCAQGSAPRP